MIWVVARARGLLIFAGVLLASAVAAWVAGRVQANLPLADGPRYLRQYLVAFLPAGMGPALPDRLPGLSATLLREPLLRRCTLLLYWGGLGLVLGPGWVSRPGQLTTYEIMTCLVLGTVVLAVTARWGVHGVLVGLLLGLVWMLAGDSIGVAIGFPGIAFQHPGDPELGVASHIPVLLGAAAFAAAAASVGLLRSTRVAADEQA